MNSGQVKKTKKIKNKFAITVPNMGAQQVHKVYSSLIKQSIFTSQDQQ